MLQINEDWRIRPEALCWILEERKISEDEKIYWQNRGYYVLLEDALKGSCNHIMKESDSISALLKAIESLKEIIVDVCKNYEKDDLSFLD